MIERVEIDSDESGFHLILHGEIEVEPSQVKDDEGVFVLRSPANLRLSQDAAWQLVDAVQPVAEWRAEGEAQRAHVAAGLGFEVEYGGDDADVHPVSDEERAEALREAGDLERKRRREQA